MRPLLFFIFALSGIGHLVAQPTLSINTPIVSDNSWKAFRDVTLPFNFGFGTGPNTGNGDINWFSINSGDSALTWSTASAVSVPSCLQPYGQVPIAGTSPIWFPSGGCSNGGNSSEGDVVYFRKTFYATPSSSCRFTLFIKADNKTTIYVNGMYLAGTENNWVNGNTYDIGNLLVPGPNVVAVQVFDDGITGWMSLKIAQACPVINIKPSGASDCSQNFYCGEYYRPNGDNSSPEGADFANCCRYKFSVTGIDPAAYKYLWTLECCDVNYSVCENVHTTDSPSFIKDFQGNALYSGKRYRVCLTLTPLDGSAAFPTICTKFRFNYLGCGLVILPFEGEPDDRNNLISNSTGDNMQLYPNPNSGSFTIKTNSSGNFDVTMYNQLSVLVKRESISLEKNGEYSIHAEALPTGIYRVIIRDVEGTQKPSIFNVVKSE